jgi:hypothetical protein
MKELAVDLKALDPAREIDPRILLKAYRYKRKGTIICADVRTKAAAERIIAC